MVEAAVDKRNSVAMRRTTRLRDLVCRPELAFLMEAHNGLSARIVDEAGFEGIWASGLTLSASLGVRDNNELSWSQVTDHVAFMADCTEIPILLDGDTGYGNFNNMRRLVRKLEQIGVAGVTIEDKQFPKANSFLRSETQPLADIEEFCGKIKAGKDSQRDPDFVLVARVEALIAGWGLREALRRAEAYRVAGADAILIHSRQPTPAEVFAFLDEWAARLPIVLVPTTYYTTPVADFRARHVGLVVWANHLLRAGVIAMQETARRIAADESLMNIEPVVAPLREIFRLQGDEELEQAEAKYLPTAAAGGLSAVVLAASAGSGFGSLTANVPKAMLKVRGQPILARLLEDFRHFGGRAVTVVRGYQGEALDVPGAKFVDNPDFASTGEAYSLSLAETALRPGCLLAFGDIVVKRHVIQSLLEGAGAGITLVIDSKLAATTHPDRARCDRMYTGRFSLDPVGLLAIGEAVAPNTGDGVWIGLLRLGDEGATWMQVALSEARAAGTLRTDRISDLLSRVLAKGHPLHVAYIYGEWVNVNDTADLIDASAL